MEAHISGPAEEDEHGASSIISRDAGAAMTFADAVITHERRKQAEIEFRTFPQGRTR